MWDVGALPGLMFRLKRKQRALMYRSSRGSQDPWQSRSRWRQGSQDGWEGWADAVQDRTIYSRQRSSPSGANIKCSFLRAHSIENEGAACGARLRSAVRRGHRSRDELQRRHEGDRAGGVLGDHGG